MEPVPFKVGRCCDRGIYSCGVTRRAVFATSSWSLEARCCTSARLLEPPSLTCPILSAPYALSLWLTSRRALCTPWSSPTARVATC